jgi:hypothetical protein
MTANSRAVNSFLHFAGRLQFALSYPAMVSPPRTGSTSPEM